MAIVTTKPNCQFSMIESFNDKGDYNRARRLERLLMRYGTLETDSKSKQLTLTFEAYYQTHTVVFEDEPLISNGALVFEIDCGETIQTYYVSF